MDDQEVLLASDGRGGQRRSLRWWVTRRRARRTLRLIDGALDELEQLHELGRCLRHRHACHDFVARIAQSAGRRPPEPVWRACTSYALHAALLDWQAGLLDQIIPGRRELFPDLRERDEWAVPRLGRIGRGGTGRRRLKGAA